MAPGTSKPADVQQAAEALLRKQLEKLGPMLEQLRTHLQGASDVVTDITNLLGDGQQLGAVLREMEAFWGDLWRRLYNQPYVWKYVQDRPNMKRLIRQLGADELGARMQRCFAERDPWMVRQRFPFGGFVATINQYAGETKASGDAVPPIDCRHQPPCLDEVAHSARCREERRLL